MKSERRHDLEKNELATRIVKWLEKIGPYTNHIIVGALALLVVYVAFSAWGAYSASREQAAWDAYTMATYSSDLELDALRRLAEDEQYFGTRMQEWAYLTWADRQLLLASHSYLADREATRDRLTRVLGVYQQLAAGAGARQVQDRARFGLGQVYEMQNKLEDARETYLLVTGDLAPLARDRAEQLESERVQEATAWLATAELPQRQVMPGIGAVPPRPDFGIDAPVATPPAGVPDDPRTLEEILMGLGGQDTATPTDDDTVNPVGVLDEPLTEPADDAAAEGEETVE